MKTTAKTTSKLHAVWIGGCAVLLTLAAPALSFAATPPSTGDGTTQPKPKPAGPIERLEKKLGRALTQEEKTAIGDAKKAAEQAIQDARIESVEAIAAATNLSIEQVKTALATAKTPTDLIKALQKAAKTKLTTEQKQAIKAALKAAKDAEKAAKEEFFNTVASLLGLTPEDVKEAFAPPKPADKPAEKPADKPNCDKPTGQPGDKPANNPGSGDTGGGTTSY